MTPFSGIVDCLRLLKEKSLTILLVWILLELAFFFGVQFVMYPQLNKLTQPAPPSVCIISTLKRTVDTISKIKCYSHEKFLSRFHRGAKFEDIKVENFRSLLAWAMYGKHVHQLLESEVKGVEEVKDYADAINGPLPEGFNPNISHCQHTLDPLRIYHRPLIVYVVVCIMELVANFMIFNLGEFTRMELDGMRYWYRARTGSSLDTAKHDEKPVLFFHGISTGWMAYGKMVHAFAQDRTIVLVDIDAIKMKSLQFVMPTPDVFCAGVVKILNAHKIGRVSVVGHSFGSISSGWFVTRHPDRVSHLTLIDPVSLLLCFPEVVYHFLYRAPRSLLQLFIYAFVSREITIASALCRNFWWYNNHLWLEDIAPHIGVVVGISSKDVIICADAVHEYVSLFQNMRKNVAAKHKASPNGNEVVITNTSPMHAGYKARGATIARVECVEWKDFGHGAILIQPETQKEFLHLIRENERADSY